MAVPQWQNAYFLLYSALPLHCPSTPLLLLRTNFLYEHGIFTLLRRKEQRISLFNYDFVPGHPLFHSVIVIALYQLTSKILKFTLRFFLKHHSQTRDPVVATFRRARTLQSVLFVRQTMTATLIC